MSSQVKSKGQLFLIPVDLAAGATAGDWIGVRLREVVQPLRHFAVEHPKTARQFLKRLCLPLQELQLHVLDEHSGLEAVTSLIRHLEAGIDLGLVSEAGCPAIADPGATLVAAAHHAGIRVVPLVGPSSITLALMASGLNGQRFAFTGYLPVKPPAREQAIRDLEARSRQMGETQIFIEAPYRNDALFAALATTCSPDTQLCLASDLMADAEEIVTKTIVEWRRAPVSRNRRPTVFLMLAPLVKSSQRPCRSRTAD